MSKSLIQSLQQSLAQVPASSSLLVGFSGGLDSTVLLHVLSNVVDRKRIQALHLNHGLAESADNWQRHCQAIAKQWQVDFISQRVQVRSLGAGIEDAARTARMAFFEKHLGRGAFLLLAHHLDDQQETLLLRLLRGSGPTGLAAMAGQRPLGQGHLLRPWLSIPRLELERYAQANKLTWVEDPSNQQSQFDRNFLRNEILPPVNQRWPEAANNFARSAELCRDNESLLMDLAQLDIERAQLRRERLGASVSLVYMQQLTQPRQANLVRHLCRLHGIEPPGFSHWQQLQRQILAPSCREDSQAMVTWAGGYCAQFAQRLFVLPKLPPALTETLAWCGQQPLPLPGNGSLSMEPGGTFLWDGKPLQVSARAAGLRAHPATRGHSQTLKKLLQEYRLEPWLRSCVPLIYQEGALKAVADLWVESQANNVTGQPMRIVWHP